MCLHGPYIVDYRNQGSGVKVGGQAPRLKILNFLPDTLVLYFGPLFSCIVTVGEMVQNVLTGKKYGPPTTLPKWGSKILGGTWHFFWFASSEGGTPHPSGYYYFPVDPGF